MDLFALNGRCAASSFVPVIFAVRSSASTCEGQPPAPRGRIWLLRLSAFVVDLDDPSGVDFGMGAHLSASGKCKTPAIPSTRRLSAG